MVGCDTRVRCEKKSRGFAVRKGLVVSLRLSRGSGGSSGWTSRGPSSWSFSALSRGIVSPCVFYGVGRVSAVADGLSAQPHGWKGFPGQR